MRKFVAVASALIAITGIAVAQRGGSSAPDPFILAPIAGTIYQPPSTFGRTPVSSVPSSPSTTAVIITGGQSLMASQAAGSYATVSALALNFNIYDGGTYPCLGPVLGTQAVGAHTNSPNCQLADGLISGGTYTSVIVVPIAVGSTLCSDWIGSGIYAHRVTVTMARLASRGLTPASGFAGDLWIAWHQGESDAIAGTVRATLADCYRTLAASFTSAGSGTARFFIPQSESLVSDVTAANVIGAQADAVASGCSTCRAGPNWDTLTIGTGDRIADGTHFTQTGNANAAARLVTVIANCKATAC